MSLIHTFPSEILGEIFLASHFKEVISASHVSRQWRQAAIGTSELWLSVGIHDRNVKHSDVLVTLLQRSQRRKICLQLHLMSPPVDRRQLQDFMVLVKPHLCRCHTLTVYAPRSRWERLLLPAFDLETWPSLRHLEIASILPAPATSVPHNPIDQPVFPLPGHHPLQILALRGIDVGEVPLPHMTTIRVTGRPRRLVGDDGCLNRWFIDGPLAVALEGVAIPDMQFQDEDTPAYGGSVQHLTLSKLIAAVDEHGLQTDCTPFFDALQTPHVRTLHLEAFYGRVWDDFLFSLNTAKPKYPEVARLRLLRFDFQGLPYAGVLFFLYSFPALTCVVLAGCNTGTWESLIHVLMLHPPHTLCPSLDHIHVDGVLLNRVEPLPFAHTFEIDKSAIPTAAASSLVAWKDLPAFKHDSDEPALPTHPLLLVKSNNTWSNRIDSMVTAHLHPYKI
ncbi:hypothetical protein B0H10DRAFT_2427710 [Mycena sp. CBHHK59/15]|nr:hypothetical protein B0H10DRAFT_2427710 [Mycena sp. CBHHK59/15]